MKTIVYKMIKGDKESIYKKEIPDSLFKFLDEGSPNQLDDISNLITRNVNRTLQEYQDMYVDLFYSIISSIIEKDLGMKWADFSDFYMDDITKDEIIVIVEID